MAHQNVLNRVLLVKSVVNVKHSPAGVTPNVLNVFGLKRFHEDFGATQLLGCGCGRRSGCHFGFIDFHIQPL
jgi:hypothetical protein